MSRRNRTVYFPAEPGGPPPLATECRRKVRYEECDPLGMVWHGRYAPRLRSIPRPQAKCHPPRVSSAADCLFSAESTMPVYTVHAPIANSADFAATGTSPAAQPSCGGAIGTTSGYLDSGMYYPPVAVGNRLFYFVSGGGCACCSVTLYVSDGTAGGTTLIKAGLTPQDTFATIAGKLEDPRVEILVKDAIEYIKTKENEFDIILIDSTDPMGPGEGLFTEEFYTNVKKSLKKGGIVVAQSESPVVNKEEIKKMYSLLKKVFPITSTFTSAIPTYPGGYWAWASGSSQVSIEARPMERRPPVRSRGRPAESIQIWVGSVATPVWTKPWRMCRWPSNCSSRRP